MHAKRANGTTGLPVGFHGGDLTANEATTLAKTTATNNAQDKILLGCRRIVQRALVGAP